MQIYAADAEARKHSKAMFRLADDRQFERALYRRSIPDCRQRKSRSGELGAWGLRVEAWTYMA